MPENNTPTTKQKPFVPPLNSPERLTNYIGTPPVEQVPQDLPTTVHHLFHRTLTEGLTNARKHAPGAPVTVSITGKELTVVTETAGTQEKPGKPGAAGLGDGAGVESARGAGLGLVGVRERARLLGATVEVTDHPHTLKVSVL